MFKRFYAYGVLVFIHNEQGAKHKKPHIHVKYCEYDASFDLNGNLLAGNIPLKKLKATRQWIKTNQHNLYNEWYKKNPTTNSDLAEYK